jgi:Flp pilus assembly protein TadB
VSKERARRRAERLVVAERERVARARATVRRQRRRAFVRRITRRPRRGRTGRLFVRRSRGQRAAIAVVTLVALTSVWLWVGNPALRIILTALVLLALPVFVVVALDRRS